MYHSFLQLWLRLVWKGFACSGICPYFRHLWHTGDCQSLVVEKIPLWPCGVALEIAHLRKKTEHGSKSFIKGKKTFTSQVKVFFRREQEIIKGTSWLSGRKENSRMDVALLLEYGWVLLVLIALEGILAADNALVMAVIVKHLPAEKRRKALFYGLAGAFIFRFASLFIISYLVDIWQLQALGALYLIYLSLNHVVKRFVQNKEQEKKQPKKKKQAGFWMTVLKVELADIAFAVDSILAAVALAVTLSPTPLPPIGGLDGGKFLVILAGGMVGLIIMRFAASYFVTLLHQRPGLETAAFLVVGWVGVKLAIYTLAHPRLGYLPLHFPESTGWEVTFWSVLIFIFASAWFLSGKKKEPA